MKTAAAVYDLLIELLEDDLGKFANGATGIWVIPPQAPIGTPKGLICTIQRSPEGDVKPVMDGSVLQDKSWIINLVNYDFNTSLQPALEKIERSFVMRRSPFYLPPTEATPEQVRCWLYSPRTVSQLSPLKY